MYVLYGCGSNTPMTFISFIGQKMKNKEFGRSGMQNNTTRLFQIKLDYKLVTPICLSENKKIKRREEERRKKREERREKGRKKKKRSRVPRSRELLSRYVF